MWNCYVFFFLLTGKMLYKGDLAELKIENLKHEESELFVNLSPEAKKLLRILLQQNPEKVKRITKILNNKWLHVDKTDSDDEDHESDDEEAEEEKDSNPEIKTKAVIEEAQTQISQPEKPETEIDIFVKDAIFSKEYDLKNTIGSCNFLGILNF